MANYPLFLGIDLGTTSVRSFIFDEKGEVLGRAFRKLRIYRSKPGMAEEDPEEIWAATLETMRESLMSTRIPAGEISMISFSAQMHGMAMIERDGSPLTRLLTWLDRRSATQSEELGQIMDSYEIYSRTGCPLLFTYPLAKILWVRDNMPEKFDRCYKVLSAKDYVIYRMFGEPYIDRSLASGTQLLNIHKLEWDEKILEIADINEDKLPTLSNETEIIGELPREIAELTGLKRGTPVIPGGSDGALSNIGLGAVEKGVAAVNIGTSGAMRMLSDKPFIDEHRDARFFCYYATLNNWLPGGAISNAGIILRWLRDTFGQPEVEEAKKRGVDPYELILEKAGTVEPGADGLLMLPFFAGERFPIRDSNARGVLFGLTLSHHKAHIARAVLESIIYTLRWIMETLEAHGAAIEEVRIGGGGARSAIWRQIQADVLGKPLVHTKVEEASALGAAMLSAITLGIYRDLEGASRNMVKVEGRHEPDLKKHQKYTALFGMYKELYKALKGLYEDLSTIQ